jgi:hypothetical protein
MKFIVAALSLLVLVAFGGSVVAMVMGAGGYLPDLSTKADQGTGQPQTTSPLMPPHDQASVQPAR